MNRFRFLIAVPVAALLVLSGYGASSLLAGASSTPVSYFACLNAGTLTKVGTKSPKCPSGAKVITWNQVGPSGAPGAKGDTGAPGAKGDTGAPGAKGDTGVQGDTGAKGDTGPKGDPGVGVDYKSGAAQFTGFSPFSHVQFATSYGDSYYSISLAMGPGSDSGRCYWENYKPTGFDIHCINWNGGPVFWFTAPVNNN